MYLAWGRKQLEDYIEDKLLSEPVSEACHIQQEYNIRWDVIIGGHFGIQSHGVQLMPTLTVKVWYSERKNIKEYY